MGRPSPHFVRNQLGYHAVFGQVICTHSDRIGPWIYFYVEVLRDVLSLEGKADITSLEVSCPVAVRAPCVWCSERHSMWETEVLLPAPGLAT